MLDEVVIEGYVSGRPWTHSGDPFSRRGWGSYRDRQRPAKRTTENTMTVPGEVGVAAITRDGKALIPTLGSQFRAGDTIHFVVLASAMERFESLLGLGEGG